MKIQDVMNTAPGTVRLSADLREIACAMACNPYRLLHVLDESGRLKGIISSLDLLSVFVPFYLDSDLARAMADDDTIIARGFRENAGKTAESLMRTKVIHLKPGDPLVEAEVLFRENGFNTLPVLDKDKKLLGEVSRRDVLRALVKRCCNCDCPEE